MSDITVFGAGAFGTALAIALSQQDRKVTLISRTQGQAAEINAARENHGRLPGIELPPGLTVSANPADPAPICLLAIPTQKLAGFLTDHAASLVGRSIVACCKGVDLASGHGPTRVISDAVPSARTAILSGPSFAVDIAAGLPTALTLAAHEPAEAEALQHALSTPSLRLYRSTDVTGVELGGALKNIVAIAAGVAIGAGLGESARASVITRGYAEMRRFADSAGALPATLSGLAGFGDLVLTCTSEKSRNYAFGLAMGRGDQSADGVTIEGAATAKAVTNLAKSRNVDLPLTRVVAALVENELTVEQAIEHLLSRPLKEE